MFKDVFVLKKDSYNVRMMKYIWNWDHREFSHMCPYFWLSVFNHLIIVFVFLFKVLRKFLKSIAKRLDNLFAALNLYFKEREIEREKKLIRQILENPSKVSYVTKKVFTKIDNSYNILDIFDSYSDREQFRTIYYDFRSKIEGEKAEKKHKKELAKEEEKIQKEIKEFESKSKYISYEEKQEMIKTKSYKEFLVEEEEKRKEAEKQRIIRNKQRITNTLKIIKPILTYGSYIIGSALCIIGFYYLIKLVAHICKCIAKIKPETWTKIGHGCSVAGIVVLSILILITIIYLLVKLIKSMNISVSMNSSPITNFFVTVCKYIAFPFIVIGKLFMKICRGIKNGVLLVIQMIKNECPAIKWED